MYFLFHLNSFYPSLTQTTKCSKIPTLKVRGSFGNHYVLVYFNLTRALGCFLVISALKAINLWLSTERACNAKLALSFTMRKKFRLYAFTFPIFIYSITCCTLLNKTHVGARKWWWKWASLNEAKNSQHSSSFSLLLLSLSLLLLKMICTVQIN